MSLSRVALIVILAPVACSSSPSPAASNPTDGSASGHVDGDVPPGGDAAAAGEDGATQGGGPGDGSTPDAPACASSGCTDGGIPADAAPDAPSGPPVLTHLGANQTGRTGADLLLTVQATGDTAVGYGLDIQLKDTSGTPVVAFANWAGTPTDSRRTVLFDAVPPGGSAAFPRTVTLAGMMHAFPTIGTITASIVTLDAPSNAVSAHVTLQTVASLNQSCDTAVVTSRCSVGLACAGSTPKCSTPSAPQITQFAYLNTTLGGRMLLAGTDPADDLDSIHFEFLDATGQPVLVDLTGNGGYQNYFDKTVAGASSLGKFFVVNQSSPTFDTTVLKLAATPSGSATGTGNRVLAALVAPPVVPTGSACDPRGFAGCGASDACVASVCVAKASALDGAATTAPVLDPSTGATFAPGYALGPNLWGDPPSGCAATGVKGFPEGIVLLHLAQDTASLTLTTDNPETNIGAALFVVSGTGSSADTQSLGCKAGLPATLTLTNMLAGDYTVVVASTSPAGGNFGVSIR